MITISVCMIVKNEEKVLKRCLTSLVPIADEIIVVDTGSTDRTKEIASEYTKQIYDFTWVDDFSQARNFSFSKATMDYIYIADADEVLKEENCKKFLQLKQVLLSEIDIVQMYYENQLQFNTTYNYDKEYRPKLFKRLRTWIWQDEIHESVRLDPVIYDSEIAITHLPEECHAERDFRIYQAILKKKQSLSDKLIRMYAKELYIAGQKEDFITAGPFFETVYYDENKEALHRLCECVLIRYYRYLGESAKILKMALHNVAVEKPSSEVLYEIGEYYVSWKDYKEATIWFYNAAYEAECELNIHYGGDYPLKRLSECYSALKNEEQSQIYEELANKWMVKEI